MASQLTARYAAVQARVAAACVRAGRPADAVRLVAVSKGMPAADVHAAIAAGARDFGENYVQEAESKRDVLAAVAGLRWHFIGRVQRNKANAIATFDLVHSVADERVAAALAAAAEGRATPLAVLLQVNVAGEATKSGVTPGELSRLLAAVRRHASLRVAGLMTLPPPLAPEAVRPVFAALRELRDRQEEPSALPELSMGMSGDFEVAIEEGATLVRVGTAIFGPRKEKE